MAAMEHLPTGTGTGRIAAPAPALAVLSGAFLAGAMLSITLLTIPVIVDTTAPAAPQSLLDRWVSLYHYGHRVMPALAIVTCLLYVQAVYRARQATASWRLLAMAGAATISILPFTWFVMGPTNNALFQAQAEGHGVSDSTGAGITITWEEALKLVTRWTWLHTTRSMMPLVGACLGMWATVNNNIGLGTTSKSY